MKRAIGCLLTLIIIVGLGYLLYKNSTEILEFIKKYTSPQEQAPIVSKEEQQKQPVSTEKTQKISSEYNFTLSTIDGQTYSLSDFQGKVVLLDFWATWCPPCRMAIPYLCDIYQEYKNKGLVILGICCEQDQDSEGSLIENLRKFRDEYDIPYPILMASDEVIKTFKIEAIPAVFVFDRYGQLIHTEVGFNKEGIEKLKEIIEGLLSNKDQMNYFGHIIPLDIPVNKDVVRCSSADECYAISIQNISDKSISSLQEIYLKLGIGDNPYAQLLFLFVLFSSASRTSTTGFIPLDIILNSGASNIWSNAIAVVVIMNKMGWDINCFYNDTECYLGINFSKVWHITKKASIIDRGRQYVLKEFDTETPAGQLNNERSSRFRNLKTPIENLKPIPAITSLPEFKGEVIEKELSWQYIDQECRMMVSIPKEMVHFTENLPASTFGMVMCGIEELKQLDLTDRLKSYIEERNEYHQVNFLLKFCQSKGVFAYDSGADIKSVSRQLLEGKNDCDGRSVFLYVLLISILDYSIDDIVFLHWPFHYALGLKPKTELAESLLIRKGGVCYGGYWVLDPTYTGETYWGYKMPHLPEECEIIRLRRYMPATNEPAIGD